MATYAIYGENPIVDVKYENGKISERTIRHANGHLSQREVYKNGELVEERMWSENGKLITLNISDGTVKERRSWHDNGALLQKSFRRGDILVGEMKLGYENGRCIYHFYLDGICRDQNFTTNKKITLLRFKNKLCRIVLRDILSFSETFLIPDLFGTIILHI